MNVERNPRLIFVENIKSPSAFFKELKLYYSHPNKYYWTSFGSAHMFWF